MNTNCVIAGIGHAICDQFIDADILGGGPSRWRCLLRDPAVLRGHLETAEEVGVRVSVADILSFWREHHWCYYDKSLRRCSEVIALRLIFCHLHTCVCYMDE